MLTTCVVDMSNIQDKGDNEKDSFLKEVIVR